MRSGARTRLEDVRVSLCQRLDVAEELVPLQNLSVFFGEHERHAKLALEYPGAHDKSCVYFLIFVSKI